MFIFVDLSVFHSIPIDNYTFGNATMKQYLAMPDTNTQLSTVTSWEQKLELLDPKMLRKLKEIKIATNNPFRYTPKQFIFQRKH